MKRFTLIALFLLASAPARADIEAAVSSHILPGFVQFAQAALALEDAAETDCQAAQVQPAFQTAFDAWIAVADLHIGPSVTASLPIAFWPDDRSVTPRALTTLINSSDPIGQDPLAYADVSIATRGLFALEMLLYDPAFASYSANDYTCALVQTIATDLARQATALQVAWSDGFAATLLSAGAADNATYLSRDEVVQALYTQLLGGLEFTADNRLGRPMGTFDRPRPRQAEAWRSGRSLRNVVLSAEAAHALAHSMFDGDLPVTDAAFERVRNAAAVIVDPAFQDVTDPQARLRVEVLQQSIRALRTAIQTEIGDALSIKAGFNSLDGD